MLEAVVGPVDDLVYRKGRRWALRMLPVMLRQRLVDLVQPLVELGRRPRVQRRKASDDACLALGNDQVGVGDDEQRRADDRNAQVRENRREAHRS